mgnify:FL=1
MQKKKFKIIFISGLAIFVLWLVFFNIQENISVSGLISKTSEISTKPGENKIAVVIIAGDKTLHLAIHAGTSLYNTLLLAKKNGQLEFSYQIYPKLGSFVTDIGSLHSGKGKYLIYYVNNKEASVGVSSYLLKDGDIVEWKLK